MKNAIKFGFGFYLGKMLLSVVVHLSANYTMRWLKEHDSDMYRKVAASNPEAYERLIKKYPEFAI